MKNKELAIVLANRKALQNKVFFFVRNYDGKLTDVMVRDHDGTPESIIAVAGQMHGEADMTYSWKTEFYNTNSQTMATTARGELFNISPNLRHMAEFGTSEFNYIFGDVSARIES